MNQPPFRNWYTMLRHLLIPGLLLISLSTYSQREQFGFIQFAEKEGLGASQILDIEEDRYQNLWLLTFTGSLYRFDGVNFKRFGLSDDLFTNNLYSITITKTDSLCILSDRGLIIFEKNRFKLIDSLRGLRVGYQAKVYESPSHELWIIDDLGNVAVRNSKSLQKLELSSVIHLAFKEHLTELTTRSGAKYQVGDDRVVRPVTGGIVYSEVQLVLDPPSGDQSVTITGKEVFLHDRGVAEPSRVGALSKNWNVRDATFDNEGNLFILADQRIQILLRNKLWASEGSLGDLPNVRILGLHTDSNGNVWLAADGKGLILVRKKMLRLYQTPALSMVGPSAEFENGERLVGTFGDGLYWLRDGVFRRDLSFNGLDSAKVIAIERTGETTYIGTFGEGLWELTRDRSLRKVFDERTMPSSNYVSCIYEQDKSIIIGTGEGVILKKGHQVRKIIKGPGHVVNTITRWKGRIIVGFFTDGLHILQDDEFMKVDVEGLENSAVNCLVVDSRNRLLVGANRSFVYVFEDFHRPPTRISLGPQIANVSVMAFVAPMTLLVGTEGGAYLARLNEKDQLVSLKQLNGLDGYVPGESTIGSLHRDSSTVWFGTSAGLYSLDPRAVNDEKTAEPNVYINQVTVPGMEETSDSRSRDHYGFYRIPQGLELPYAPREISIGFFAHDLAQGARVMTRYKLEPVDRDWIESQATASITYSSLPGGSYTFQVQARNQSGEWVAPAIYAFTVEAAWWQTTSFIILLIFFTVGSLALAYRWLSNRKLVAFQNEERLRLQAATKIREQVAMDFHDELGNKLAAIVAHANVLKVKQTSADPTYAAMLDYVEDNARQIYQGTRDFIWSIDTKSNDLRELTFYVKDFGESLFSKDEVNFFAIENVSGGKAGLFVQDGMGRHVVLFCKEALTNVYKHAHCRNVWFDVHHEDGNVLVSIEDDGMGIGEKRSTGSGLRNMQKRAERIGGRLAILARKPTGTRIEFNFHL